MLRSSLIAGVCLASIGCQPSVPGSEGAGGASGGDAAPAGDSATPPPVYPHDDVPPVVVISDPTSDPHQASSSPLVVHGMVSDDVGIAALRVKVGPNVEQPADQPELDGSFALAVTIMPGTQLITVRAIDVGGNEGTASRTVTLAYGADTAPPSLAIVTPIPDFTTATPEVSVTGTAADDVAVVSVTVSVDGAPPGFAHTDDNFAHWYYPATVEWRPDGQPNVITARAEDVEGKSAETSVTGSSTAVSDRDLPLVAITAPADGFETDADDLLVTGTAFDAASGLDSVEIRVGVGPYNSVTTSDDFATWSALLSVAPGDNLIKVKATDRTGNAASDTINVINTSGDTWTPRATITLTWAAPTYPTSTFNLDKAGLAALMSGGVAEQITMLELDLYPVVSGSLGLITEACGPGWAWSDVTASCPAQWGQAEINMFQLITMTPANVNVAGTSIEGMEDLASTLSSLGLISDFHEILAESLGIGLYDTIVSPAAMANAMFWDVMVPHPNTTSDGYVVVTMADALEDMTGLAAKFDAAGSHPGFLDSVNGSTYAEVMTPSFQMSMVAASNLHWHDGVDLASGKAYLAVNADVTGPTYDDVLEFDFLSPSTFTISGLAANPTVDLVFKMYENDSWLSIGDSRWPLEADPGWPVGNSAAWDLNPWELEFVLIDSAYVGYWNHRAGCDLCDDSSTGALLYEVPVLGTDEAEIVVGRMGYDHDPLIGGPDGWPENFAVIDPNPAGWMRVWTLFGLGSPPEPQYVWDMILEVCEQRLLDGGVAQGDGDVRFPLDDLAIGMTGEEVKDATRPVLEAQKSLLSELLLGDVSQTASALDFYLARGADGQPYLYFVHASDPVPPGTATHTTPGFFADEALTQKVSFTAAGSTGDSLHEKLALASEQTVYCQDTAGRLYRLNLEAAVGTDVTLYLRQRIDGT